MALRARVVLTPGGRAQVAFVTAAAGSREAALEIAGRYASAPALDWATEDALRSAAIEARRLGLDSRELAQAQALCRDLVLPRRPASELSVAAHTGLPAQPELWGMDLSGDLPIVLVRVADDAQARRLPIVIWVHQWWLRRGLRADLVILREGASGYQEPIRELLFATLREASVPEGLGGPGGVHPLAADRFGASERRALEASARLSLDGAAGSLVEALATPPPARHPISSRSGRRRCPTREIGEPSPAPALAPPSDSAFDNSYGGARKRTVARAYRGGRRCGDRAAGRSRDAIGAPAHAAVRPDATRSGIHSRYPPGVRENDGQYTHAVAWLGLAHARLGEGDSAYAIFDLINPVRRSADPDGADLYRAEPYVLPGDVRGADPDIGQAG